MKIFGRPLSDYVGFCRVFLILIAVIGISRLVLSLGGVPNLTARWLSMTALAWIGVVFYSVRVHTTRFGSYKHLLVIIALLNITAQLIAIVGIAIAMATGTDNIYSAPEYAFGSDGKTWLHLGAHVVIGTTIGTLLPWIIGSAILAVTKRLSRSERQIIRSAS
jgi:hypothetical protein